MFLAYVWVATPLLLLWLAAPALDNRMGAATTFRLRVTSLFVVAYLIIRTLVAIFGPPRLRWDAVFPPMDVISTAALVWAAGRDPLSNLAALYLLAVVEVSESQSVFGVVAISVLIAALEALATWSRRPTDLFGEVYPYIFLFGACTVSGLLARSASKTREELAVAKDRERIAFEMHDGVQGHLVTMASQLELVSHLTQSDPKTAANIAREGRDLARLAADELRYLVHRLRSPSIQQGFGSSLTQFAYLVTQRTDIDLKVDIKHEVSLRPETEHALFRIAQEAINNSIKHGDPATIEISLNASHEGVELTIADDGIGFELSQPRSGSFMHSGLDGMSKRAEALGGTLLVRSDSLSGTAVTAKVPSP